MMNDVVDDLEVCDRILMRVGIRFSMRIDELLDEGAVPELHQAARAHATVVREVTDCMAAIARLRKLAQHV